MIFINRDDLDYYVSLHGKNLTRLCLKLCRNSHEAENLYQETWCRVVDKIHLYNKSKPFEPWLFTICVNIFKNLYKKAKNTPVTIFDGNEEMEWAINNAVETKPIFNEEHDLLRQIINELDEKHRIVIILYYFSDYSLPELASIIRIPQGTVKSRLHKAREIIKRRLEDNEK